MGVAFGADPGQHCEHGRRGVRAAGRSQKCREGSLSRVSVDVMVITSVRCLSGTDRGTLVVGDGSR